jgi:ribosomal protein S18 acetylase RimI-like enzyme
VSVVAALARTGEGWAGVAGLHCTACSSVRGWLDAGDKPRYDDLLRKQGHNSTFARNGLDKSREILTAIEHAAVRSWPALETADIDGWLWRYASGGSQRANSVSTLAFTGTDVETAITEAERRYRANGSPCWFTVSEVSAPHDLDERLAALGYAKGEEHLTMAKEVSARTAIPADVELADNPTPEWLSVYLTGLNPNRKAIAPTILAGLPAPRTLIACSRGGAVVGTGLSVADGELASVQCMATLASARRNGCARSVLAAIEAWAAGQACRRLYLQAEAANIAAIALYESFGFRVAGRYHLRSRR